ncbi:glycerate kinase family protein [Dactylosporangium sp. CA-233914]|uniref:glycerate kinase family protein n=1 Tax=Dactylosporangium sp. CA-233914 TaxID=3239934 RepID=UPI003D8D2C32
MRVVAAPDKYRGSASANEIAAAIAKAVEDYSGTCTQLPLADGGEGTLDAFGGPNRWTEVTGPLGLPVKAGWRLDAGGRAVIEMARASGLVLAGGAEGNDPYRASTHGTGELIAAAVEAGARRIVVAVGGSATTDGGLGALEVLANRRIDQGGTEVVVCCDVNTRFTDAARVFGPQKGASPEQVEQLTDRLIRLQDEYTRLFGVTVADLPGAGAAGGLAGGLAALGARLVSGFDLIAAEVGLPRALPGADLVITGEGLLDAGSFEGKVVGGVTALARQFEVPVLAVVGAVHPDARGWIPTVALVDEFGETAAWESTLDCVRLAVQRRLAGGSLDSGC